MKLDRTQTIAGHPILKIRDMFKRCSEFCRENVEWLMRISPPKANKLIKALLALGYIELAASQHDGQEKWYHLLPIGRTLALARAVPPMKRAGYPHPVIGIDGEQVAVESAVPSGRKD